MEKGIQAWRAADRFRAVLPIAIVAFYESALRLSRRGPHLLLAAICRMRVRGLGVFGLFMLVGVVVSVLGLLAGLSGIVFGV